MVLEDLKLFGIDEVVADMDEENNEEEADFDEAGEEDEEDEMGDDEIL
jgi:hypothetical protein